MNDATDNAPVPLVGELQQFLTVYPLLKRTQPEDDCLIDANNDVEAIQCWLAAYRERSEHTVNAYRKEAIRYLLWLATERQESLGDANQATVESYSAFLLAPGDRWCGPRKPLGHSEWRPFEKGLSHKSRTDAIAALKSMYAWLCDAGYLRRNPFKLIKGKQQDQANLRNQRSASRERVLFDEEWELVLLAVEKFPRETEKEAHAYQRALFLLHFLYYLGPRTSEILSSDMSSFRKIDGKWWWETTGKGGVYRKVPMNRKMLKSFRLYRIYLGLDPEPCPDDRSPLLYSLYGYRVPLTTRKSIYSLIKQIFELTIRFSEDDSQREKLSKASTHWLRHTFATRADAVGISTALRKEALGHVNEATTNIYTHHRDNDIHEEFEKL